MLIFAEDKKLLSKRCFGTVFAQKVDRFKYIFNITNYGKL